MGTDRKEKNGIRVIRWSGYEWLCHPIWGDYHPDDTLDWYDETLPYIADNGNLMLPLAYRPRTVAEGDTRTWAVCKIRTEKEFRYGTFEWEAKLPRCRWIWPALWLTAANDWPPEIDCMEGWTDNTLDYRRGLIFREVKPTVHWHGRDRSHEHKSKNNILFCRLRGGDKFDRYKVVWTPDYVDIYYNDKEIKRFKDKVMLAEFNKPETEMHPVISFGVYGDFDISAFDEMKLSGWPFEVKSFRYTPLS